MSPAWTGQWVADRLGLQLITDRTADASLRLTDLVGLALRHNPRRVHLLVSTVLGKHQPTDPLLVYGAGRLLGAQVADRLLGRDSGIAGVGARLLAAALAGRPDAAAELVRCCEGRASELAVPAVVLGFAETATGLGHSVADSLDAWYLHSTRRRDAGGASLSFEEEHSHATGHLLLPAEPGLLDSGQPMVLVEAELSTGQTAMNTISALQQAYPS
ncbi:MAG: phosphoribosyltransferase domain-containing protein, partial [Jatrophihabitans sp.]